jgi:DNA-binding XRE family transcriptional regulator
MASEFISLLEADKRAPSLTTLNKIAAYLTAWPIRCLASGLLENRIGPARVRNNLQIVRLNE